MNGTNETTTRPVCDLKTGDLLNLGSQTAEVLETREARSNRYGRFDVLVQYQSHCSPTWERDLPGTVRFETL
jgi:hypothetical protein